MGKKGHRWRIVWKCGCRSTHFAVVHPQKLMKHPWRTSDTVLVVRHGCSIHFCGCTTAKWVLRHPHFHTILHLWIRLRHESRDKYAIHISKTALKKCYFETPHYYVSDMVQFSLLEHSIWMGITVPRQVHKHAKHIHKYIVKIKVKYHNTPK